MQLNRYIAHAGLCSRRKALELIELGFISVNNEVQDKPYFRVQDGDIVKFKTKIIKPAEKKYYLLNKPKGYITSAADEQGRKTVVDLVMGAVKDRIYPVGRLDKDTTGLLVMTNDGDLSQKLAHPKFKVKKVYTVTLDKPLSTIDIQAIRKGLRLKDGFIKVDSIKFVVGKRANVVRVQLKSGKNRIIRRIFQGLGYFVIKLDRINFAGLTKRNLSIGHLRRLSQTEIKLLQS